jgi:hypothetical protein
MYELLGITLVLALLLTINALATMAAAGACRVLKTVVWHRTARTRAEILFVMRIGPPAIALIAIVVFMIPSYLAYEPYATREFVSFKLGALAMISAVGVGLAIWRSLVAEKVVSGSDSSSTFWNRRSHLSLASFVSHHRCSREPAA